MISASEQAELNSCYDELDRRTRSSDPPRPTVLESAVQRGLPSRGAVGNACIPGQRPVGSRGGTTLNRFCSAEGTTCRRGVTCRLGN
jgi:hypothetical protein